MALFIISVLIIKCQCSSVCVWQNLWEKGRFEKVPKRARAGDKLTEPRSHHWSGNRTSLSHTQKERGVAIRWARF